MAKHFILISLIFIMGCKQEVIESTCDLSVLIDSYAFNNDSSNNYSIDSIEIENNCLIINFGSSGCDASSWQEKLIDSEEILESFPPQRNLIFSLENNEICLAYFTKEVSFDISELQIDNQSSVVLNFGDGNQLLYQY